VTVKCTVNKKKHLKYWLKHNTYSTLNRIQRAEVLFSVTLCILHYKCVSITQNTYQLYFNYKIQIPFIKVTKYKIHYSHFIIRISKYLCTCVSITTTRVNSHKLIGPIGLKKSTCISGKNIHLCDY